MSLTDQHQRLLQRLAEREERAKQDGAKILLQAVAAEAPVRSGKTKNTLDVDLKPDGLSVTDGASYVQFVINGTNKTPPNNFVQRAFLKVKSQLQALRIK